VCWRRLIAAAGCSGVAITLVPPSARLLAQAIRAGGSSKSVVAPVFSRQRGFSKKLKKGALDLRRQ
jgi:glycine/D-amino acid oxidase-like deaminating enzyme